ncbi:MAG: glycerol-3-phosphate dehydrogenase/oxidase [Aliarcobacter sp.]|nr:glycerol-3-phosphate dehydrogenase/oxidase [Aliarcobacter sp.]
MELNNEKYDIVIIGGGCVGSGIVLDATLRGYKVILLEKNDFASGASSKSSKLVHGGVRYLEKAIKEFDLAQYNLVKEGLSERAIFLRNAPNISKKLKINIPIYSYLNLLYTYIGLLFYKLIAKHKSLGKNSFVNKVVSILFSPNIKQENLKGFLSFYDGSFLDSRMIISLLQSAVLKGAVVKNYCEVNEFLYDENNKISGVRYFDKIQNETYEIKAKVVVNASGANVDNLRILDDKDSNEILALSSGIHIVVSKEFLKAEEGILIPNTSDKRVIFILPYMNHCLIGTTDNKTIYEENPKVKEQEIEYLLKEVNNYFEKHLTKEDILSSWSGIRPLVKNENKSETQEIVREHLITKSKTNLVSIVGGKWTTYRKMSEDLLNFLIKNSFLEKQKKCETKKYKLFGNDGDIKELEKLMSFYPISKKTKESLITLYGTACTKVLTLANENKNFELINENLPYLKAEILYCINYEFVKKPIDFLSRRVGLCFIDKKQSLSCVNVVCVEMGKILFWDEEQILKEQIECTEHINNCF